MAKRRFVELGFHIAIGLAVQVAVISSPIRALNQGIRTSQAEDFRRNFVLPQGATHRGLPVHHGSSPVLVKAVLSKGDDELPAPTAAAGSRFERPSSQAPKHARALNISGLSLNPHPLRC
jgi:hypothetical protein